MKNIYNGFALVAVLAGAGVVIIVFGFLFFRSTKDSMKPLVVNENGKESMEKSMTKDEPTTMENYQYSGSLTDVSGGNASGTANATFDENGYIAFATFENLPELEEGFFYEGWVVRNSPLDVISSGALEMDGGNYINNFKSETDLTDHNFYVLTLEPDDGDPAPAEHILEGILTKN